MNIYKKITAIIALIGAISIVGSVFYPYHAYASYYGYRVRPYAVTIYPQGITPTSIVFNGEVNGYGSETSYWFEYGVTTYFGLETIHRPHGLSNGLVPVSERAFNLTNGATYYYRIVAENSYGRYEGDIMSVSLATGRSGYVTIQTPTYTNTSNLPIGDLPTGDVPPQETNQIKQTTAYRTKTETNINTSCINVVATFSSPETRIGDEVIYTVAYKNGCTETIQDVTIQTIVPGAITIVEGPTPIIRTNEKTVVQHEAGNLTVGSQGSFVIHGVVHDTQFTNQTITVRSLVLYTDARDTTRTQTIYAYTIMKEGQSATASVFDAFKGLFGSWVFGLLLLLIVLCLIYWIFFKKEKKHDEEKDNGVDVLKA